MNYFDAVKPTYLENWPAALHALHALSITSQAIPMTVHAAKCLGSTIAEWGETFGDPVGAKEIVTSLETKARDFLKDLPGECGFIRLGSRSPKDSWEGHRNGFKVHATDERPPRFIQDCSERMYEDLTLAAQNSYAPTLWVRQWIDLEPWQEWRCFMRGRRLIGISQYDYLGGRIPECVNRKDAVKIAIEHFFPEFRKASHLEDVVFDVFVTWQFDVTLLEVNPFFDLTNPCLYSWKNGGDFDGGIRVVESEKLK